MRYDFEYDRFVDGTMAHQDNDGSDTKSINAGLVTLRTVVIDYARSRDGNVPDLSKHIDRIKAWVEQLDQETAYQRNSKFENMKKVENMIETTVSSLNSLMSGETLQVMKGCLDIAKYLAFVVGGPFGPAVSAVFHILGTILSIHTPKEPNLATVFAEKVQKELKLLSQTLKSEKFSGIQSRARSMLGDLTSLKTRGDLLSDKILYETDFPQFIGEVAYNFSHGLNPGSKDVDVHDCLTSMVAYCHAVTSFLVLLSNVLVAFQTIGNNTECIVRLLNDQIRDASEKLEYLSDPKTYSSKASFMSPNDKRKLYLAFGLRNNLAVYEIVEEFRQGLGMTKMPRFDEIKKAKQNAELPRKLEDITHGYDVIVLKYTSIRFFQFINHTSVPVKVVCDGNVGNNVNALKFRTDLQPFTSYERQATGLTDDNFFSTGGYFIIYLDGKVKSFKDRFEGNNLRVFSFSLSFPMLGIRKIAILDKTNDLDSAAGNDCWKQMNSNHCAPINFDHAGKYYTVHGKIKDRQTFTEARIWQFIVQEDDPSNNIGRGCRIPFISRQRSHVDQNLGEGTLNFSSLTSLLMNVFQPRRR